MIKQLFFTGALLVPGLAYAGTPSATLPGQIVPASNGHIPCDQGPSLASIPAPAQEASFTHCALNADFSTSTTDANGINWSNPNTWLNGCGATNSRRFYLLWGDKNMNVGSDAACNRAEITTDQGSQVLHFQFQPSDYYTHPLESYGNISTGLRLSWPAVGDKDYAPGNYWLPFERYQEITYRLGSVSYTGNFEIQQTESSRTDSEFANTTPPYNWLDFALTELWNNGASSASTISIDDWVGGTRDFTSGTGFKGTASFPDPTNYHTLAWLVTSDGSATVNTCVYYDGVLVHPGAIFIGTGGNCGTFSPRNGGSKYTQNTERFSTIIGAPWPEPLTNQGDLSGNVDIYIKSIRIWACSGYSTGAHLCPGPLVFHQG
jgi:hypothetical protein